MSRAVDTRHLYGIILAGGLGTRLWPLSREHQPKQLQPLVGNQTLLKQAYLRVKECIPAKRLYVAASAAHHNAIAAELKGIPNKHFLWEPSRKEKLPPLQFITKHIAQRDPKAVVVVIFADHVIPDKRAYRKLITRMHEAQRRHPDHILLAGITPTYPETGYGYIRAGQSVGRGAWQVKQFIEKPNERHAKRLLKDVQVYWNPGIFMWSALTFVREVNTRYTKLAKALYTISDLQVTSSTWSVLPAIELERGFIVNYPKLLIVPTRMPWADVGNWRSIVLLNKSKGRKNIIPTGQSVALQSQGNFALIPQGKLVALLGVDDLVIVDTPQALLVTHQSQAQHVREIVAELKRLGKTTYL